MEQQQASPVAPCTSPGAKGEMVVKPAGSEGLLGRFFQQAAQLGLGRSLLQLLQKMFAWAGFSIPVETIGSGDPPASSPSRPVRHAKKRLGRLACFLFAIVPCRLQNALGYLPPGSLEIRKTPVKPCGKGSKRKQDDVALEDQQSWVEVLQEELPEQDDPNDATYESWPPSLFQPSKSETDSEEYRSQNETETDLEFEEQDGVVVLKESPNPQVNRKGENVQATATGGDVPEKPAMPTHGEEASEKQAVANGGDEVAQEQQAAASSGGSCAQEQWAHASGYSDSQEQWVELSG
ncbi:uncharacterized protein LOC102569169 isoform X2 [Alligator mississippiensis]|uniref:uncharacterized protein LOC102569169 isoform X2 n=1 Tax=Alligator mississippiensis TaxID=8496 RepID=UPI0028776BA8|nr:uncharacterized protein LOC102569169 isoform X2 [Alligator mississippiensis]